LDLDISSSRFGILRNFVPQSEQNQKFLCVLDTLVVDILPCEAVTAPVTLDSVEIAILCDLQLGQWSLLEFALGAAAPTCAPQEAQNTTPSESSALHLGQWRWFEFAWGAAAVICDPQEAQNAAPSETSALHLGHFAIV
jgi:hypothetical protein